VPAWDDDPTAGSRSCGGHSVGLRDLRFLPHVVGILF
jgi:hypothetical protein